MKKIKFESISYCKPMKGICKQYSVWLNQVDGKNVVFPLVFFQKPKWIDAEQWKKIMSDIGLINN
jgi:hypothetical protein